MGSLEEFIQSNPPSRELKRALSEEMIQKGYSYREIRDVLKVSLGFVSNSHQRYIARGVEGLKSNYWGTVGYLNAAEKQELLAWLGKKDYWTIDEVIEEVEVSYGVRYQSLQSYYNLLHEAGYSWKKSHPQHPAAASEQVAVKKKNSWS